MSTEKTLIYFFDTTFGFLKSRIKYFNAFQYKAYQKARPSVTNMSACSFPCAVIPLIKHGLLLQRHTHILSPHLDAPVAHLRVCVHNSLHTYLRVCRGRGLVLILGHSSSQGFCEILGFMPKH